MLSDKDAFVLVRREFPDDKIVGPVFYKGLFLFQVFYGVDGEENMDPFFSVDQDTGELRDFSPITDGNIEDITNLFLAK